MITILNQEFNKESEIGLIKKRPASEESVWVRVVFDWMSVVGSTVQLTNLLTVQSSLFKKLGISCEWFVLTKPNTSLTGVRFTPLFGGSHTFFQEFVSNEAGTQFLNWYEVSSTLFEEQKKIVEQLNKTKH